MRKIDNLRPFLYGVLASIIPAVAGAWAFATVAANYVIGPHLERAKERVHLMCLWAQTQQNNTQKICEAVGVRCEKVPAEIIMSQCEEMAKGD